MAKESMVDRTPRIPDLSSIVEDEGCPDDDNEVLGEFQKLIPNLSDANIKKAMDGLIAEMETRVRAAAADLAVKQRVLASLRDQSSPSASTGIAEPKPGRAKPKAKGTPRAAKGRRVNEGLSQAILAALREGPRSRSELTIALGKQGKHAASLGVLLNRLKKTGNIIHDPATKVYRLPEDPSAINNNSNSPK